jgi:UDP-2,4-diacetamido-2,4,6-trideoxy-beta-L-altropyranose hydrolase
MTMRFLFRTDASTTIGLGHVRRCLSLAHAVRQNGGESIFLSRALDVDVAPAIRAEDFKSVILPRPDGIVAPDDLVPYAQWAQVNWQTDAAQTIAAVKDLNVDLVIVDHYAFDSRWQDSVGCSLRCKVAAIDDVADRAMSVDFLIDHNKSADHQAKYAGRLDRRPTMLVGPMFALLGPTYASAARHVPRDVVRSVGVFMGGIDLNNLSELALHACRDAGFSEFVEIVSTHSNPNLAQLREAVARDGESGLSLDVGDLAAFFARHDVQVGASGGALWERCCIGSPTLSVIAAANQRAVLMPLAADEVMYTVASIPPRRQDVSTAMRRLIDDGALRRRLSTNARNLVDGLGADRVAKALLTS